jgi:hypothetical protein
MKVPFRFAFVAPLALALLAGCGSGGDSLSPTATGTSVDDAAVQRQLALHPELVEDDGLSTTESQVSGVLASDGASPAALQSGAALHPLFFWRHIRDVERRFEIAYADSDSTGRPTVARVTVIRRLRGTFNVAMGDSGGADTLVRKPLDDRSVRHLVLRRVHRPSDDPQHSEGWRIVASSAVRVRSRDAVTRIQSVRVQAGALDTTVTDPLAIFRLRQILRLPADENVTLTVTTGAPDDVVLLYTELQRFRFHRNGDGTYTGTWSARRFDGFRHFGVNALSRGTLWDPAATYDSEAWILPYRVSLQDPGEYRE